MTATPVIPSTNHSAAEIDITPYLEDLESRINPQVEDELLSKWKCFAQGQWSQGIFSPFRSREIPPSLEWPKISVNAALEDFDLMILQQLENCSGMIAGGGGGILSIRANYGVGILSTVFGAKPFIMDEKLNTLPNSHPLPGGMDAIRRILDAGVPDLRSGYGGRCLDMGRHYVKTFSRYPKISKYVQIYHPDLQGAMDLCELLWGSELFVDMLDEPELVHSFLKLITETYILFMREWQKIIPPSNGFACHWAMGHKGCIMLRDDSAMNLSPQMFEEFIRPYDQQLLNEFGGGAIHFCGRGDHYIEKLAQMKGVYAINLTQPEYNDMEVIFRNTVDKKICLLGLPRDTAEKALQEGRDLRGCVHSW